ncbi:alpha/beta hydrolase [Deferrisoma camini]|uniref:alpha/beta hydrolase n=1 Tax=Deferrisoma camini TaxID=1035120 RepID=UPI00046D5852|nr:alpha/beta hydrolase [Deferrisoma camini]
MRRTVRLLALPVAAALALAACGSPPDDNVAPKPAPTPTTSAGTPKVTALYDPTQEIMPLPNDLVWLADGDPEVELSLDADADPALVQLAQVIEALGIQGLSPNMFLTIPVSGAVDESTLQLYVFRLDAQEAPRTQADFTAVEEDGVLKLVPKTPFSAGGYYAVAIKTGLLDENGFPVEPSPVMNALKSQESLVGTAFERLEDLRAGFDAQLFPALEGNFRWSRGDVLLLWTFHTADSTLTLADEASITAALSAGQPDALKLPYDQFGDTVATFKGASTLWPDLANDLQWKQPGEEVTYGSTPVALPPSVVWEGAGLTGLVPNDALGSVYFGKFSSPVLSTLTAETPTGTDVPFVLLTPSAASCGSGPYTTVLFQHGLGRSKEDAFALANSLAKACLATFAIDAPFHGDREVVDEDTGEAVEFFSANLLADRANVYQAAIDLWEAMDVIQSPDGVDLDGDGDADLTSPRFVAHSLGSIIGSVFLNADDRPEKILLSSPSAGLANVLDSSSLPDLQALVGSLGFTKGTTEYYVFLNIVQWLMDPVDGAYMGIGQSNGTDKLLAVFAYDDPVVTDVASRAFLGGIGIDEITEVDPASIDAEAIAGGDFATMPAPVAGAYQYGVSGKPIVHSFLLSPATVDTETGERIPYYPDTLYDDALQMNATSGAQAQGAFFLAPSGD